MKSIKLTLRQTLKLVTFIPIVVLFLFACNKDESNEKPSEVELGRLLKEQAILTVYKNEMPVEHDTVTWEIKEYNDREKITYYWYRDDFYDFNYKNNPGNATNYKYNMDGTLISESNWSHEWSYSYPNDTTMILTYYNHLHSSWPLEIYTYYYENYEFSPHTVLVENIEDDFEYILKYDYTDFNKIAEKQWYYDDILYYVDVYKYDSHNNLLTITVHDVISDEKYLLENNSYHYDNNERISEGRYSIDLETDANYYVKHQTTYYDNNKVASELISLSHDGMDGPYKIGGMLKHRYEYEFYTIYDGNFYKKLTDSNTKSASASIMNQVVPLRKFRKLKTPIGETVTIRRISHKRQRNFYN